MKFLTMIIALICLFSFASAKPTSAEVLDVLKERNKSGLVCCAHTAQPWTYVPTYSVLTDIDALKTRGGTCGVNGRTCVQIACTNFSEVVLCNDNDYRIEPNCAYLASYAEDILGGCYYYDDFQKIYRTCGQRFDTDQYNIIVKQTAPDVGCPN